MSPKVPAMAALPQQAPIPISPSARAVRASSPLCLAAFLVLAGFFGSACENKAIGRTCDTLSGDSMTSDPLFNDEALECPTRLCIRPARIPTDMGTGAFCTAECSDNGDCEDGERRGNDATDKRCTKGFTCGISMVVGPLACKKLCICKDFVPEGGLTTPAICSNP